MKEQIGTIIITEEKDILRVRQAVKSASQGMTFKQMECIRIATAASELTRNIYEHAESGKIFFEIEQSGGHTGLVMIFQDKGRGIDNLDDIMRGEYESQAGLGIGLLGAQTLMDDFDIETSATEGTTVTIKKWLPRTKKVSKKQLDTIKTQVAEVSEESAIQSLKAQNRELIEVLGELRKANAQFEETNRELDTTNAGIIALYQELDKKNEELTQKSQHKSVFLRSFGHETRTPINSIITLAGILKNKIDGSLTPEQEKQVGMIDKTANHMLAVVNGLLDLSRIEAGIIEIHATDFSVEELFSSAGITMMPLAMEKGLDLQFEAADNLPMLHTDFKLALQILLNLLGNAVKYTDQGKIRVNAGIENGDTQARIFISVTDTGIGIPEDKLDLVFKEFKQVHSRDDIPKGTGLGLSISKKTVETLGGTISATSSPGKGSTFSFSLPVELHLTKPTEEKKAQSPKIPARGDTILIIEDDEKMIYSLKRHLEAKGYSTLVARTPEKALKLAAEHPVFAVSLDIMLPREEDGWNTLKALKRNPKTRNIPVVVNTCLQNEETKALVLGANDYITKPVDFDLLNEALNRYQKIMNLETILVVDDEEAAIMGFQAYLKGRYSIETAFNGKEAIAVLERKTADLILLDLVMPVMDGFEFLQWLRNHDTFKHIPVIVYSSKDLSETEEDLISRDHAEIVRRGDESIEELSSRIGQFFGTIVDRKE